jgi:hypothetical protein
VSIVLRGIPLIILSKEDIMKKTIITLVLALAMSSTAFAQEGTRLASALGSLAGDIIGSVIADGAVATKCGARIAVDRAVTGRRGDSNFGRYVDASDYRDCRREADQDRRDYIRDVRGMAQQQAMQAQRTAELDRLDAARNAPQCTYRERDGQVFRDCTETVVGAWRR